MRGTVHLVMNKNTSSHFSFVYDYFFWLAMFVSCLELRVVSS